MLGIYKSDEVDFVIFAVEIKYYSNYSVHFRGAPSIHAETRTVRSREAAIELKVLIVKELNEKGFITQERVLELWEVINATTN